MHMGGICFRALFSPDHKSLLACLARCYLLICPHPVLSPHLPLARSMVSQQIWAMPWLRTTLGFTQFTASYMKPGSLCGASR